MLVILALVAGAALPVLARNQVRASRNLDATPATSVSTTNPSYPAQADGPPRSLRDTGLYVTGSVDQVHPDNLSFMPQYPLWSDGADKRRWLNLPSGTWIDASRPDAWDFPVGTRLWKEFSHAGTRIETRLIQRRADRSWLYVSYVWNEQGTDATLAPAEGVVLDNPSAPTGRYEVPSRADCLACHEGAAAPVLGASAVQLSRVRDTPLPSKARATEPAPELSMMDLQGLIERGLLRNFPQSWQSRTPGIASVSETEREALGYLHGNCGHCHNHDGAPAAVALVLAHSAADPEGSRRRVLLSAVNARSRYRPTGMTGDPIVIAPGRPEASVIEWRMRSRHASVQMPPLGTLVPDDEGIDLIRRWIANGLFDHKEPSR
jgi:hypothetical protein